MRVCFAVWRKTPFGPLRDPGEPLSGVARRISAGFCKAPGVPMFPRRRKCLSAVGVPQNVDSIFDERVLYTIVRRDKLGPLGVGPIERCGPKVFGAGLWTSWGPRWVNRATTTLYTAEKRRATHFGAVVPLLPRAGKKPKRVWVPLK